MSLDEFLDLHKQTNAPHSGTWRSYPPFMAEIVETMRTLQSADRLDAILRAEFWASEVLMDQNLHPECRAVWYDVLIAVGGIVTYTQATEIE